MMAENVVVQGIRDEVMFIKKKLAKIEIVLDEIDTDIHRVKPGYLKKLDRIEKGKFIHFKSMEEFDRYFSQ